MFRRKRGRPAPSGARAGYYQEIVKGLIIVAGVVADVYRQK
ncbi:hypothetical protein [uncultured Amaricoccus sp.]|nr:hypothetical protein [uncultured Amaricoccus sp.]